MRARSRVAALASLTALLLLAVSAPSGLAKKVKGIVDLEDPHFPPAERPLLEDIPDKGIGHNFKLIEHNPLVDPFSGETLPRGGNGNDIAIVRNCLYASSRSNVVRGTLIVDISNPKKTKVVGALPQAVAAPSGNLLSTADMAAIESENLLIRQVWNGSPPFDGNHLEIFDTTNTDCDGGTLVGSTPTRVSTIPLPDVPHEHFIWQGGSTNRILIYLSFSSGSRALDPFPAPPRDIDLRVYDITNKFSPLGLVAMWSLQRFGIPTFEEPDLLANANQGQSNTLHSMSVSADGTRAYLVHYHAGFYILDSTPLATGAPCDVDPGRIEDATPLNPFGANPNACLKKLHPDPNVRLDYHPVFTNSHSHTAVKVPNRPYVVISDEPSSNTCPWSWVRIANVDDTSVFEVNQNLFSGRVAAGTKFRGDLFPQQEGAIKIPENAMERCAETRAKFPRGQGASFNAHKPLVFENLIFMSWLAGGVRAFDISNAGMPFETGFFFNKPVAQTARGGNSLPPGLVNPELQIRNYPTLRDGLLYFLDGASGLYVLKYTGQRREEIPEEGLFTQQAMQVPGRQP